MSFLTAVNTVLCWGSRNLPKNPNCWTFCMPTLLQFKVSQSFKVCCLRQYKWITSPMNSLIRHSQREKCLQLMQTNSSSRAACVQSIALKGAATLQISFWCLPGRQLCKRKLCTLHVNELCQPTLRAWHSTRNVCVWTARPHRKTWNEHDL